MWLFAKKGFFSIVADRDDPGRLLVRARVPGDIEKYWPDAKVETGAGSDYMYRAFLPREEVQKVVGDVVGEIDYDNFKANIDDKRRRGFHYARVWSVMAMFQDMLHRGKR